MQLHFVRLALEQKKIQSIANDLYKEIIDGNERNKTFNDCS